MSADTGFWRAMTRHLNNPDNQKARKKLNRFMKRSVRNRGGHAQCLLIWTPSENLGELELIDMDQTVLKLKLAMCQ